MVFKRKSEIFTFQYKVFKLTAKPPHNSIIYCLYDAQQYRFEVFTPSTLATQTVNTSRCFNARELVAGAVRAVAFIQRSIFVFKPRVGKRVGGLNRIGMLNKYLMRLAFHCANGILILQILI